MLYDHLAGWLITFIFLLLHSLHSHAQQNETNCLALHDNCKNSLTCRSTLKQLRECGSNSFQGCLKNNSHICSTALETIRTTFGLNSTCSCNVEKDKFDACIEFRTKIWQDPCAALVEETQKIESLPIRSSSNRFVRNSEQIQRWKKEFSQEIRPNPSTLSSTSCTTALFELCLKHISCRELWKLFRHECSIDSQNNCLMTNKNDCWQSFEGISWTGLGNCTCDSNNSDCHWIRLQTNYNKCIYEITSSGDLPNTISVKVPLPSIKTTSVVPYWETSLPTTTPYKISSQTYSYQTAQNYTPATNWWTNQTSSQTSINLQQKEYQREYARREQERRQYEQKLREYEEKRRRWEEQNQQFTTVNRYQPSSSYATQNSRISPLTTTTTQTSYIRATYVSTATPQSFASQNESKTYRLNGAYYRTNYTQTTPEPTTTTSTTQKPKPTRKPKIKTTTSTTSTTTTTTTSTTPPTTTEVETTTTEKPENGAHLPMQFAMNRKPPTTTSTTTTSTTPIPPKSPESTTSFPSKSSETSRSLEHKSEEKSNSNVDEAKLRALKNEQRPKSYTIEELEDYGVLVSRWELPVNKSDDAESTCAQAHENCERDETCRWHISELQMKCRLSEDCQRTHCASAMRRFARYVNKSLLESMMFCQCAFSDVSCKHQQNWMYPRCLYDNGQMKPKYTCSQAVQLCQHDSYCSRTFNALNRSCPLSQGAAGGCIAKDLAECRLALIGVRGTDLESPCYCDKGDEKCLEYQNMVLPNNPCVEDSMIDFVESGSIATASDRQLPKIKSTKSSNTRRNQKKSKITTTTTSTTTSTTTTTEAPPSEENELVSEEIVESNEEEEKTSETVEEDNQLEESEEKQLNNLNATAVSSENLSKKSTIASEIKTNMPSKGIKISKKPGTSTAKIISGQKLVTQTPPSTEKV